MITARDLARRLDLDAPTAEQAEVIESPLGAAVVIAGAGSGKTATMATRVVWLVANGLVPADGVLGLTFTRKASAELGARIRSRLRAWAAHADPQQRSTLLLAEPTVLTYAAYCGRLVADHALRLGLEPSVRLISPAVAWQLADVAVRRHSGELSEDIGTPPSVTGYVLQLAAQLADHLQDPVAVGEFTDLTTAHIESLPAGARGGSRYPGELARLVSSLGQRRQLLPLVADFQRRKQLLGAVDFADQMVWAARLAELPQVREIERRRYPAVLLDEYQDTGHAQIALLAALFGAGHPITAVGDPFQSIYSWRGASAGNIGRFPTLFADAGRPAARFTLSTSWRNDRSVLTAANAVAAPLRSVHPGARSLGARPGAPPGRVVTARLRTVEDEATWLARHMAAHWSRAARGGSGTGGSGTGRTAAVLVRRRSQIPLVDAALRAAGLPVQIVGLGGLLITPEVSDVVATLRVLADYAAGASLLRLLTGARWRIGPRDLAALARRSRELANPPTDAAVPAERPDPPEAAAPAERPGPPEAAAPPRVERHTGSIVEALDDLGDRSRYSPVGFARLASLAEELSGLRRRLSAPLAELVAEVERVIGVDVEVAARPDRREVGRVHLDRFLDAAAAFAADSDVATLGAFLAYLSAAEKEENGLEAGEVEVESERVQIMTVHGAKGLEWDIVGVPGLVEGVFPADPRDHDWTRSRHLLPFPLRGDAGDLPHLDIHGALTRRELAGSIRAMANDPPEDHRSRMLTRHRLDERRLAYVAVTRARHVVLACGYLWDATVKAREPSDFLISIDERATRDEWYQPEAGETNPHDDMTISSAWPHDPLGYRRAAVQDGADRVRAALRGDQDAGPVRAPVPEGLTGADADLVAGWQRDVPLLLAERAAGEPGPIHDVGLPARLSVSQLVALQADPEALARRLHRPMPARPAPLARRGTAFHLWLEQRWAAEALLDLDELPGSGDESAVDDADLGALRDAFLASRWADRRPVEVEVPFEMVFEGVVVRGRMDAVFADDGGWLVVDWKTGAVPTGAPARAAAVQLAAYRLAWQRIVSTPARPVALQSVRAAFHYVRTDTTVAPADLLDADGLRALVTGEARTGRDTVTR